MDLKELDVVCLFEEVIYIYIIGGFDTLACVNVSEYKALRLDKIVVDGGEQNLKVSCVYQGWSLSGLIGGPKLF